MIRYQKQVAELLAKVLGTLTSDEIFLSLEKPQLEEHGDIAFPCFSLAKTLRTAPPKISQELAEKINRSPLPPSITKVVAVGPYLNFHLSVPSLGVFLQEIIEQKNNYGSSEIGKGTKILLEYSSPNVAKEFHLGHFRNTILGQSLCNILKKLSYEVTSINHLGDWGSQFGKVAYAFQHWGNEEELQKNPLGYLTQLYVLFHEEAEKNPGLDLDREARLLFKKIEEGEAEYKKIWQRFVDLSIQGLKKIYQRMDVQFDHYLGESFYFDKISVVTDRLQEKNLLKESEGATIVDLEAYKMPPCLILTGDGTTLYHTRDLAAAVYRKHTFQFDTCYYVVGSEQSLHFQQLFKVLELMEYPWAANLHHIKYGLYRFKDGKFSTRKGKVVLFQEVVDDACEKVRDIIRQKNPNLKNKEEIAEMIGLGALIFNDLSTDRVKDVEFDWQKILDFEGDTGPYLQYTVARANSILRKASALGYLGSTMLYQESMMEEFAELPNAISLIKLLGYFPTTIAGAARLEKPSIIANYAITLAHSFNSFYRNIKVIDESQPKDTVYARVFCVAAATIVLREALRLLCIKCPEEM